MPESSATQFKLTDVVYQQQDATVFNGAVIPSIAGSAEAFIIFYLSREDEQNGYGTVIQLDNETKQAAIFADLNPEYSYLFFKDEQGALQTLLWCIEFATRTADGLFVTQAKVYGRGISEQELKNLAQPAAQQPYELREPVSPIAQAPTTAPPPQMPAQQPAVSPRPQPTPTPAAPPLQTPSTPHSSPQPPQSVAPMAEPARQTSTPQPLPSTQALPMESAAAWSEPVVSQQPKPQSSASQTANAGELNLPHLPELPSLPAMPASNWSPAATSTTPAPTIDPSSQNSRLELPPLPALPDLPQVPPVQPAMPQQPSQPSASAPAAQPAAESSAPVNQSPRQPVGRPPKPLIQDRLWMISAEDFTWLKTISRDPIDANKELLRQKIIGQIRLNQPNLIEDWQFLGQFEQAFAAICMTYDLVPGLRHDLLKSLLNGRVVDGVVKQHQHRGR